MNAPLQPNVPHPLKLRVADFMLLNDSGAFEGYSKVELIEGEIICVNSQFSRHARVKSLLIRRLGNALEALEAPLEAWGEVSVHLSDDSMPEPDIVLTSYRGTGPVPLETVALLIEVADTTLQNDLGRKARMYARAGIKEYWVADVEENRFLIHTKPSEEAYGERIELSFGETIRIGTLPDLQIETTGF